MGAALTARLLLAACAAATLLPAFQGPEAPAGSMASRAPRTVKVRLYWLTPPPPDAGPLVRELSLDDYVAAVLAGECGGMRSTEALKAMAVAARTYAVRNAGRHKSEGFDFCDTTHCQDLRLKAVNARAVDAAALTAGELLWSGGRPAEVFYHAHCGGLTEDARAVWPGLRAPHLVSRTDTFCTARGRSPWQAEIRMEEARRVLGGWPLRIVERSASGRVARIAAGGRILSATEFLTLVGRQLGWAKARSARFELRDRGGSVILEGYADGHGVGLCQVGAEERGMAGHDYRAILRFYFPGTAAGITAQGLEWRKMGGERVDVESFRPEADRDVVAAADNALREAERRAFTSLPWRPRVRVYPDIATWRDATGEPGWVAASANGRLIRMQPASLLRAKRRLESTLLHEMLHLVVDHRARAPLPDWFREGLVLYLESPGVAGAAAVPLVEGHLRQPPDERSMRNAYAAARAKVARLVERHGLQAVLSWLDRGLPQELRHPGGQR